MAVNDIVLLDSLLSTSHGRYGTALDNSEVFELFCFDELLKDSDLSYEQLEFGWTDGTEDGGIDGMFLFVDGHMIEDASDLHASRMNPNVRLVIITAKHANKFQQAPLNALHTSIAELLNLASESSVFTYPFSEEVIKKRDLFKKVFIAVADRRPSLSIELYYCSRGDTSTLAENLTARATQIKDLIIKLFSNVTVSFSFEGATELLTRARKQKTYSLTLPYVDNFVSRDGVHYLLLAKLSDYRKFVTDESGRLRRYLFESNVRDYLGGGQVNNDIASTLKRKASATAEDFWWLNNGVTILATHVQVIGKSLAIENVQIVNGLQTTETVYNCLDCDDNEEGRALLVKVIVAVEEETRSRIIKATNYQSNVDLSSLRGLDKIQRDIEHYLFDHGWCYDRRYNYYKNLGKPAESIISVNYLASAIRAVALSDPASSQRQRSKSLRDDEVYRQVFDPSWDLAVFLVSLQVTRTIETILEKRRRYMYTPPIALVHYISHIFVCLKLGKRRYRPNDVCALVDVIPTAEEVSSIRGELITLSSEHGRSARRYHGISLDSRVFDAFLEKKFGASS